MKVPPRGPCCLYATLPADAVAVAVVDDGGPASSCFNAPMISASLCLPFAISLLFLPQNHIHFPADCGEQVTQGDVAAQSLEQGELEVEDL